VNLAQHYSSNNGKKVEVTTLMVRNVPNQYHRGHFMQELDKLGFEDCYDFVYLPIDRQTQWNVGYAFVNFDRPEDAQQCMKVMSGYKFTRLRPGQQQRHAQVSVAHLQGLKQNLAHFQNTAVFSSSSGLLQPWVRSSANWSYEQERWQDWESYWPEGAESDASQQFKVEEQCWKSYDEGWWMCENWHCESQDIDTDMQMLMQPMCEEQLMSNPELALWPQAMGMCDNVAMTPAPMVTYAVVYVPAQMAAQMPQVPAIYMAQQDASCPSPSATPSESKESDAIAELEDETPVLRKTNSLPNLETPGLSPISDKVKAPSSTTSTASGTL